MFYTYRQNNSGGFMEVDEKKGISQVVIIEAHDYYHANEIAKSIGIYFDGCDVGRDCHCCGDRWYPAWENEGTADPQYYSQVIGAGGYIKDYPSLYQDNGFVHYLDGTVRAFDVDTCDWVNTDADS